MWYLLAAVAGLVLGGGAVYIAIMLAIARAWRM